MKVKAIIKNERSEWEEEFDVPAGKEAKEYIESVIEYFNNTLRPGEIPREVVSIKEEVDVSKYSDCKLADELFKAKQKQIFIIKRFRFDEIRSDDSKRTAAYLEKLRDLNQMWEYLVSMATVFRYEYFEDLLREAVENRKWKTMRKVVNLVKKCMEE